jgi:hypothetical protein
LSDYNIAAAIITTTPTPPVYAPFKLFAAPMKLPGSAEVEEAGEPVPDTEAFKDDVATTAVGPAIRVLFALAGANEIELKLEDDAEV